MSISSSLCILTSFLQARYEAVKKHPRPFLTASYNFRFSIIPIDMDNGLVLMIGRYLISGKEFFDDFQKLIRIFNVSQALYGFRIAGDFCQIAQKREVLI